MLNSRDIHTFLVLKNGGLANALTEINLRFFSHPLVVRAKTTDVWTVWDLLYESEYRPLRPMRRRTVVDCGANVGMFLASILKESPGELHRYVAVEPNESTFAILKRQVELCGMAGKSVLQQAAVYSRDTLLSFDDSSARHWEHRLSPAGAKQVRAISLVSLLDSAGIDECDLLKVDIEGAEFELFETIDQWKHRVRAIVCELHPNVSYEWFSNLMFSAGFQPYRSGELFGRLPGAVRLGADVFLT